MIIGIGSDIVAISRINRILNNKKEAFLKKILTPREIIASSEMILKDKIAGYVANRFAAKEAFAKALGTGIGAYISFQDLSIIKNEKGKPFFECSSKLRQYLIQEYGINFKIHLTMANEKEHAQAFVMIEQ